MFPLASLLDPAVEHARVQDVVERCWRRHQRSEAAICLGLYRLFRDNVHRGRSRARFEDWARKRFGIPVKLCSILKWIGSMLAGLPLTLAALERGELTYTKVREFVKLADRENEAEWVEYARTHTNRQLEMRVHRARLAAGETETIVVSRVTAAERQAARRAREILCRDGNRKIPPGKLYAEMAKTIASGGLLDADGEGRPGKPPVYVAIQPCPICLDAFVPVPEGLLQVPMKEWMEAARQGAEVLDLAGHYLCDCEGEKHRKDRCPNWTPPDLSPPKSRYIPEEWRKLVQARDGFVCRMPECGNEIPLHFSHLEPFEGGTPQLPETLREHCAVCNDLIARGKIRVVGQAPYDRYYADGGEFLGWGYDRGICGVDSGSSHVGTGEEAPGEGADGPGERPPEEGESA